MPRWQLQNPLQAVMFDCDGTLCMIEGIDELARLTNTENEVAALTEEAMGKSGINPDLYRKRMNLVMPSETQTLALGRGYCQQQSPDSHAVIRILQRLNKSLFILSAGLKPAVAILGEHLSIPRNHIYAVDVSFDPNGNYKNFDDTSPLTRAQGKCDIAKMLMKQYPSIAHIGDGMNDVVVRDLVTRFIGYGGAYYRQSIAELCQFYLKTKSFAALLPLLLTQDEANQLTADEKTLYNKGLTTIKNGEMDFNDSPSVDPHNS
tara:strand:+ start:542 stop:1327 length:786 start_codon:yes stop_codon:yes gene_type:complete